MYCWFGLSALRDSAEEPVRLKAARKSKHPETPGHGGDSDVEREIDELISWTEVIGLDATHQRLDHG